MKNRNSKKIKIENQVIANNENCLRAMEIEAKKKGYKVNTLQIFGDIKEAVTENFRKYF